MWDINTGRSKDMLIGHNKPVRCLKLINSSLLASGSEDQTIRIWNLETSECLNTLVGHAGLIRKLAVLKSGYLISCDSARTINFWDIDCGECLKSIYTELYDINCFLLTDKEDIILASSDKKLRVFCN